MIRAAASAVGFADTISDFGDAVALITDTGQHITYAELARRADALAAEIGQQPRLLLIEAANQVAAIVGYLAGLRGRHPVMFAGEIASERDQRLIAAWQPGAVYARDGDAWRLRLGEAAHQFHPDLALLLGTSGSTGATRLVRLSRDAINANAASIVDYLAITAGDRAITTLPIHYSYGLSVVNSHLAVGATLLLTERSVVDPAFWSFAEGAGVTALAGVPFTFELLDRTGFASRPPPTLRTLTQAGGRLQPSVATRYGTWAAQHGVAFHVMYGQTEATAGMAHLPPDLLRDNPDCIGIAIPGGRFTLVAADGAVIDAAATPGELVYSGPNVMMGYAEAPADLCRGPEVTALHTGDIAERTDHGIYRIVGRASRFSKIVGLRISLDEVEAALARHGWHGVATGDDQLIAIALTGNPAPAAVAARLAGEFKLPPAVFHCVSLAELPRLASGKVDYRTILAAAHAHIGSRARPDDRGTAIAAAFAAAFGDRPVQPDDSFVTLGGDSLSYVSFSMALEDALGELPPGWEALGRAELEARALHPVARGRWQAVPGEVLLRALAIIGIVINHASSVLSGGGSIVLWILVGCNLARFQRPRLDQGRARPMILNIASRVILPYYVILLAYFAYKGEIDIAALLLAGNLVGRFGGFTEAYWFIEALFQVVLIIALLFQFVPAQRLSQRRPWLFGLLLLAGGVLLKIVVFVAFDHDELLERTPDAVLYLVGLGWCVNFADSAPRKWLLFAVAALAATAELLDTATTHIWNALPWPASFAHSAWLVGGIALLLWLPRLSVPRALAGPVTAIAAATFYIYLVHNVPIYVLRERLQVDALAPLLLVSLAAGVIASVVVRRLRLEGGLAN